MQSIPDSFGTLLIPFADAGETGALFIQPQMYPAKKGIKPSSDYFIFCVHPVNGSCTFGLEQDQTGKWFSERKPPFISDGFIEWIGVKIEQISRF